MKPTIESLLAQPYDCLILVNPKTQVLDEISEKIQSLGVKCLNVSRALSGELIKNLNTERGKFAQEWLKNFIRELDEEPILLAQPDLLFHPSLGIDVFTLIRQMARSKKMIVLWLGEYFSDTLTYAVPEHHHYRVWKISDILIQPQICICPIFGA